MSKSKLGDTTPLQLGLNPPGAMSACIICCECPSSERYWVSKMFPPYTGMGNICDKCYRLIENGTLKYLVGLKKQWDKENYAHNNKVQSKA